MWFVAYHFILVIQSFMVDWRTWTPRTLCAGHCHSRRLHVWLDIWANSVVSMKLSAAIAVCLLLRMFSIVADRVYSCPSGCRCTILKRQRDRGQTTVTSSEQSAAPGRKVVCQSSSPLITSVSQIPLDSLPKDTLHLYVVLSFILFLKCISLIYWQLWTL